MAVKSIEYTITDPGEDRGKVFVITRMSAFDADRWGRHVLHAAIRADLAVRDDAPDAGIAGLAGMGVALFGAIDPAAADGLLERLMRCVTVRPDPSRPGVTRALHATDIAEIETVGTLQAEAFDLHVGFFRGAARLFSPRAATTAAPAAMPGAST